MKSKIDLEVPTELTDEAFVGTYWRRDNTLWRVVRVRGALCNDGDGHNFQLVAEDSALPWFSGPVNMAAVRRVLFGGGDDVFVRHLTPFKVIPQYEPLPV